MELPLSTQEYIRKVSLFDDHFFATCFDNEPECLQQILTPCFSCLSQPVITVNVVKTQEQITSITGKPIRLDALGQDKDGNRVNIEIQRVAGGRLRKRARFYSSLLDDANLKAGDDYEELPDTYVIFITEKDFLGFGEPVYNIDQKIVDNMKPQSCSGTTSL